MTDGKALPPAVGDSKVTRAPATPRPAAITLTFVGAKADEKTISGTSEVLVALPSQSRGGGSGAVRHGH